MARYLSITLAVFVGVLAEQSFAQEPNAPDSTVNVERPQEIDFVRQVRPILTDRCFACHGPDESFREADLRLDLPEEVFLDRGGYAAIVPGDPEASEAWQRIVADEDDDSHMPPAHLGKSLTAEEKVILRNWIEQGAKWSQHWAYVAPQIIVPPSVVEGVQVNAIDDWIRYRLERIGLQPSPRASKVELIRRLSFDLTGLPPTPEEVAEFLADQSDDAYERLVDRLLASPHFGERMAVYWLDLVRYADTVGYHGDQDHSISPYRDYVIDAFNRNLSFDRFTKEQLAGDLLPDSDLDAKIASGYNRLLQTSHEGGVQPKEYLAMYAADRVRNVSTVWMGATVGCAQCHNHKFDPYTIKDFYSLAAFFADVDEAQHFKTGTNSLPTKRAPEIAVLSREERMEVESLRADIATWQEEKNQIDPSDSTKADELAAKIADAEARVAAIEAGARLTMITVAIEPREMRVLPRGNWLDDSGEVVEPAIPSFLGDLPVEGRRANRADLAEWLTDPVDGNGEFTARVFANRVWYLLFGTGLSADLIDFGGQGSPPLHPELLDMLAIEFVDTDWDIKALIKRIVLSETYQQSSQVDDESFRVDPLNRYFGRQSRFRLPAEFVRDNALAVSGLLVRDIGGASVKPYQPKGYYQHLNFPTRTYQADDGVRQWRRGVYVHWQRQFLHPMLLAFDAPRREECTAERARSNTPLAAMVLLNDPTFVEAARALAVRVKDEVDIITVTPASANDQETFRFHRRIDRAFQLAVSRSPDEFERKLLLDFYSATLEEFRQAPEEATKLLSVGQLQMGEVDNEPELAALTMVMRIVLNLSETMTRP